MDILDDPTKARLSRDTILTVGAFDGLHKGHQALIHAVVARARATDRTAALVTFHPHPAAVLVPDRAPRYLTTPAEKMALLEALGIDLAILLPFDRSLAETPARAFVEVLVTQLRLRELWIGADFALGRYREGNVPRLQRLGGELGFEVHAFEPLIEAGREVSSSRIRALLREGKVKAATELLGRYASLSGPVVAGAGGGRGLGFATASLEIRPERSVPADGVYAVFAVLGAERLPGVANIGGRPGLGRSDRTVEIHILDFDRDIDGCDLAVEFVARLRAERRFESTDDLAAQLARDSHAASHLFESLAPTQVVPLAPSRPCRFRFREVEHTADRALWVRGDRVTDLFAGATRGMFSLMADLDGHVATDWREIRLESWDHAALLVDWLNELLFLTETEGLVFVEGHVEFLDDKALVGRAGGSVTLATKAYIKAATFHDLELVQDADGWSTVITFDV